jgi:hypothetical protein
MSAAEMGFDERHIPLAVDSVFMRVKLSFFFLHLYGNEFQQPPLGIVRTFVKRLRNLAVSS